MKALRLALNSIRIDLGNFIMIAALYLCLPLFISMFMSFIFTTVIREESSPVLTLTIIDEDETAVSQALIASLEAAPILDITEDADFELRLPAGFSRYIDGESADPAYQPRFRNDNGGSGSEELLLNYINEFGRALLRSRALTAAVDSADLDSRSAEALAERLADSRVAMPSLFADAVTAEENRDLAQTLNDQYAVGFLSYIIIMFAMAMPVSIKNAQKKGLYGRIHSTPSSKADILLSDFYSYWWLCSLILFIYVVVHRAVTGAFAGNLLLYAVVLVVYAALVIALASLLSALVKHVTVIYMFITVLMILQVMSVSVGGMLTLGEESFAGKLIGSLRFDRILVEHLEEIRLGVFNARDWVILAAIVAIALACLRLAVLREEHRKEVRL